MLFGKKKKTESESAALLRARDGRTIQYMTVRDGYNETVLGKDGVINVVGDELVISCGNKILLRAPVDGVKAYELMNLSGIDVKHGGKSYVAYYTKGIENK